MAKQKLTDKLATIVDELEPLDSEERHRLVKAAFTILGESSPPTEEQGGGNGNGGGGDSSVGTVKQFFANKDPKYKGEELAVAARYRELRYQKESHTQAELKQIFTDARRNFDAHNFRRDTSNARTKGLFNKSTGKDHFVLSHFGQNFVDTLPDRAAIKKLRRPRKRAAKKSRRKTKTKT